MELITRRTKAAGAADLWKHHYWDRQVDYWSHTGKREVYERLIPLGPEPDPDKVDSIIGNGSWTEVRCSECRSSVESAVAFYSGDTSFELCFECINKARELGK